MPPSVVRWEWLDSDSSSKKLSRFTEAPTTPGTYGRKILYDFTKPDYIVKLTATGLLFSETETHYARYRTAGGTYTYNYVVPPNVAVQTLTGIITGFERKRLRGVSADNETVYSVTLTFERTDL